MLKLSRITFATLAVLLIAAQANAQPSPVPASLQSYTELAMKQNPEISAARARWNQADARVGQANSNLWPKIDVTSRYTNFTGGRIVSIPGLGSFSTAKIGVVPWDNKVEAAWPIFNMAVWQGMRATKAYLNAATSEVSSKELAISYQVADAYYYYAKATELVAIRTNAIELSKQNLATAQSLFRADRAPQNDVLRAEVAVSSAQGDLLQAKNQQNLAKTNFNNLLKRDYDADIDLPPTVALREEALQSKDLAVNGEAVPLTNTYSQDLQQALATRPELQQLTSAATALEGLESVNASNYFPNLALFASYGWQEDKLKFSSESDYVAAGVQLRWNLFSGLGDRAKVAENEAQIAELEFQKENAQNGIRMEVQNARLELDNTKERYITAMKQLKSAEENRRITKAQYDAGIAPLITMIDAETTLANSKASLTVATYDEMLAEAKYRKALGLR